MKSFCFKGFNYFRVQGEVGKLLVGQMCFAHSVVEYQFTIALRKHIR